MQKKGIQFPLAPSSAPLTRMQNKKRKRSHPKIRNKKRESRNKKRPTVKTKAQIKKERVGLERQAKEFQNKQGALEQQAKNFTKLIKEGKCPVCLRPLSRGDFDQNLQHVREEEELLAGAQRLAHGRIERSDGLADAGRCRDQQRLALAHRAGDGVDHLRLIRAQAQGDYSTLTARGRPVARVRLEDL